MLSAEAMKKIDREIAKYPPEQRQSAVMSCLAIAQHEQGYVTREAMQFVAQHLGMAPIAVEEVASFYTMFDLAPVGKYKIVICTNLPCALRGANEAADHLKQRLGCGWLGRCCRIGLGRPGDLAHQERFAERRSLFEAPREPVPLIAVQRNPVGAVIVILHDVDIR